MKRWNIIWYLLTNRGFRSDLQETLFYALTAFDKMRGFRSSDVFQFQQHWEETIFNNKALKRIKYDREHFDDSHKTGQI